MAAAPGDLADAVVRAAAEAVAEVAPGTAAVLAPASLVGELALALDDAGYHAIDPRRDGLGSPLSLLPVDLANGLEFDAVVVVEPSAIADESPQGLRALYVALTRPDPAPRRRPRAAAAGVPPRLTPRRTVGRRRPRSAGRGPPRDRRPRSAPVLARRGRRPLGKTP